MGRRDELEALERRPVPARQAQQVILLPVVATSATTAARAPPSLGVPIGSGIHRTVRGVRAVATEPRLRIREPRGGRAGFLVQQGGVHPLGIGEPHGQRRGEPSMERGGCGRLLGLQSLDRGPAEGEHHARDLGDHIRAPRKPGVQGDLADHHSGSHGIQPDPRPRRTSPTPPAADPTPTRTRRRVHRPGGSGPLPRGSIVARGTAPDAAAARRNHRRPRPQGEPRRADRPHIAAGRDRGPARTGRRRRWRPNRRVALGSAPDPMRRRRRPRTRSPRRAARPCGTRTRPMRPRR